jgi:hypothetical protein
MMPRIQRRKRFPFFSLPEPKFLTRKLKKIDDFVVLVRVTPDISIFNYGHSIVFLLFFVTASLSLLFSWLAYAFSKAPSLLLNFLWHDGWMLFASMYAGYTIPSRLQIYEILFWATFVLVLGSFWVASQTRRTLWELRALRKMHTMPDDERNVFSLERFLHVSLPMWLSYSVSYKPTPEELLTLLRDREQATESQTQAIAATLHDAEDEEPKNGQEETPAISMLLTMTSSLSLSLLVPGHEPMKVDLPEAPLSLIGFLATRTRGHWTKKEEILRQVYDSGQESAFGMHRGRTNIKITQTAQKAGWFPQKSGEDKPNPVEENNSSFEPTKNGVDGDTSAKTETPEKISLFKNEIKGQVSSWQLITDCNVEVFPFMTDFYIKVVEAQAISLPDTPNPLTLEHLRQGCHHIIEEYDDGFLASHMEKDGYVWSWALPLYKYYCEQCLTILTYANQREREYLSICQTRREKSDVVAHIAQLYGWQAMVGVRLDIKDGGSSSEHDMERCLNYYSNARQLSAAQATFRQYCQVRSRIDPTYELGKALEARVAEVFSSTGKTARSRKITKEDG